jgi:hypothetical protein
MKLLIGGDSFGTLASEPEKQKYKIPYSWHTEIADRAGVEHVNVSVGGADIYSSTFRSIQAILNDSSITHLLFFITDFHRDVVSISLDGETNLYNSHDFETTDFYREYDLKYDEPTGRKRPVLTDSIPTDPYYSYFSASSTFKAYLAGMACLSQLACVCHKHNVNLIWVHTYFIEQIDVIHRYTHDVFPQPYKDFVYTSVITEHFAKKNDQYLALRQEYPGHMAPHEQTVLFTAFHQQYPNWLG